ncbi:MAG: PilZ domain-containing protein [Candidatus Omnitrophica bacterium]|nr:PilZ domain-containing protein [Candidatus Omnitrophota bacterium]MDE2215091.1 PilZ domain-containing protein [Candidatus Omnitrophota bacterium]
MTNNRQSFRLRQQFEITWSVPDQKITGRGLVSNVSRSGMLFVTDKLFGADKGLKMCFSSTEVPACPPKGRLMRYRKVGPEESWYQCGVQFEIEADDMQVWIEWMEDNMSRLSDAQSGGVLGQFLRDGQE